MNIKTKLITYSILIAIILLFLGLGFSSVARIKSAKINPKVYYTAKLIDTGSSLIEDSEDLYRFIKKSITMNPERVILIEDKSGEQEEISQLDLTYEKIKKLNKKIKSEKSAINKINKYDDLETLQESADYYYKATEIINDTCEDILITFDEEDCSYVLIPYRDEYLNKLGKDAINVKVLIEKARKTLQN